MLSYCCLVLSCCFLLLIAAALLLLCSLFASMTLYHAAQFSAVFTISCLYIVSACMVPLYCAYAGIPAGICLPVAPIRHVFCCIAVPVLRLYRAPVLRLYPAHPGTYVPAIWFSLLLLRLLLLLLRLTLLLPQLMLSALTSVHSSVLAFAPAACHTLALHLFLLCLQRTPLPYLHGTCTFLSRHL